MRQFELIAPCHFGLEAVLKREIIDLGYEIVKVEDGKVTFLGDEQAVAFHAGHSFFREAAGFRIGAGFADPAAAGAQAQGIRVLFPNFLRELSEGSGVLPFDAGVALVVNCLFQFSHGLQQDAPPARGQGGRKRPFRWSESGSGLFDAAPR